ncbi:MAG TPA: amidohydrolase family protein [Jatrophihabitans sp.]|nr:amidohydrolase family protein [Jatrophihabitans sp.]
MLGLRSPVVLVDRTRVAALVERSQLPADCQVIDFGDATLLPGLIDTHSHLCFDASAAPVESLQACSDLELAERIDRQSQRALAAGITAIRDLGDRGFATVAAARSRSASARSRPSLVCAGPPITTVAGHCHFLGGAVADSDSLPQLVRRWASRGVDVLKVMVTGGTLTPGSSPLDLQFTERQLRMLVQLAHVHGLPVTAHAHAAAGIKAAVQAGVDGLEHAKFWDQGGLVPDWQVIDLIAERGIAVCPTMGALPGAPPPPPAVAARTERARQLVGELAARGVVLVAGSDAGISLAKPHDVLPHSILEMAQCGMGNLAALRSATSIAAAVCGLPEQGRLRPGAEANVLVVDGDPLVNLSTLLRPRAVYRAGSPIRPVEVLV